MALNELHVNVYDKRFVFCFTSLDLTSIKFLSIDV